MTVERSDGTRTEEDLRIGVLGFGLRGGLACDAHQPGKGSRVVILADPDPAARAEASKKLPGVLLVDDAAAVIDNPEVEAVMILLPDYMHSEWACRSLKSGKATFVEKPLEITIQKADEILRAAYYSGSRLYVGHNMRHMPVIRQMREIIRRGEIGAVKSIWVRHFVGYGGDFYYKDWHAERRYTNSLLLQKAAHDIDVVHWLADGYTVQVQAIGDLMVYGPPVDAVGPAADPRRRCDGEPKHADWCGNPKYWPPSSQVGLNPRIDVEDVSLVNMRLGNGVLAAYQQCHFTPDYWRNYTVIGDAGRLENFGDGPGGFIRVWNSQRSGYRTDCDLEYPIDDVEDDAGHGGADPNIIHEFVRFAKMGGMTDTSPVAARMAVAVGVQATASLRGSCGLLEIPPIDPELAVYFDNGQKRV